MNRNSDRTICGLQFLSQCAASLAATLVVVAATQGALIRNFDSLPAGDTIGTGGALTPSGAPGNAGSEFNNKAAPAWGNQAASYTGQYVVGAANVAAEVGTTSLTSFTLAYAYKADSPNDPDVSARHLAIRVDGGGDEVLGIGRSAHRPDLEINGFSVGIPDFFPGSRLMDGDPNTISDPPEGSCCSAETEWVFYALTYQMLIPGVSARVRQYGMSESEASKGLQLIKDSVGYFGDALDLTGRAVIIGNTGFGGGTVWRPSDASFDAFSLNASVLSDEALGQLARSVIVPEPSSLFVVILASVGLGFGRRRVR